VKQEQQNVNRPRQLNSENELPETTPNAESLSSFKRLVAKFDFSNFFSKLLIVLYYVWAAISAILWPGFPSAVLSFIIVLLLI